MVALNKLRWFGVRQQFQFNVKYKGEAFESHSIDVRDLAPALLFLGKVLEHANDAFNKNSTRVTTRVVATAPNCFEINLIFDLSLLDSAKDVFAPYLTYAEIIIANIFFDDDAKISLVSLLKKLKGKIPKSVKKIDKNTTEYHIENSIIVVDSKVDLMFNNSPIRTYLGKFINTVPEADEIEIEDKSQNKKNIIKNDEQEYFRYDHIDEETLQENIITQWYSIVTMSSPEHYKWKLSDGKQIINFSIKDEVFLEAMSRGKRLSLKDKLKCEVKIRQWIDPTTNNLKNNFEILKVLEIIEYKEKQEVMPFINDEKPKS